MSKNTIDSLIDAARTLVRTSQDVTIERLMRKSGASRASVYRHRGELERRAGVSIFRQRRKQRLRVTPSRVIRELRQELRRQININRQLAHTVVDLKRQLRIVELDRIT